MKDVLGVALAVAGFVTPCAGFVPTAAVWSRKATAQTPFARSTQTTSARSAPLAGLSMKKEPAGGKKSAEEGDPRRQALDGVLHQIERCYGRGSILKMGDTTSMNVETTSTGNRRWRCHDHLSCCNLLSEGREPYHRGT